MSCFVIEDILLYSLLYTSIHFFIFQSQQHLQKQYLIKFAGLRSASLFKKRLQHRCLPVNFAKFLRATFRLKHLCCLLLPLNRLPLFPVKRFKDLNFQTHHCGINYTISTLLKNSNASSCMVSFQRHYQIPKNMQIDNKKCVLQEHLRAMAPTFIGKRTYSKELTVCAF